jgi:predicted RNase H-like nuclease (RuvC/YqgF family)
METEGIIIGSGAVGAICGVVGTWIKAKIAQKKARPVDSDDRYVTQLECKNCREAINKRIDELGPALNRIFKKLNENDIRSEDRAQRTHARIDPLIEKLSETKGRVDTLENAISTALTVATKGGSK